jgi:hypothetical protein
MIRLAALALGLLAAAPGPARTAARCRGRLAGAVTATFACEARVAFAPDGAPVFVLAGTAPIADVPSFVPAAFTLPRLAAGAWTLATLGEGRASLAAEGGALYTATKTSSERGEVALTLTRVSRRADGGYDLRGRYRARLVRVGGGDAGEVVVEATF